MNMENNECELRNRIAFSTVHLNALAEEIETTAMAGLSVYWRVRYQQLMGWAMSIKAYAESLDKIASEPSTPDKGGR